MKIAAGNKAVLSLFCLLAGVVFLFTSATARAVSLSPLTFEINVKPGETLSNFVTVFNNDSVKQSYAAEAQDFSAVGETGNVVIDNDAPKQVSAKQWIAFDPQTFEVEPGQSKDIRFTLNVPLDADPGGKYTSLLIGIAPGAVSGSGVGIASKVASLLLIRVAGDVTEKISVQSFDTRPFVETGPINFTLRLKNEGTVHLKPAGFIYVKDWTGREVQKLSLPQQRVIPGTIRAIEIVWDKKWLLGKYTANFAGIYGAANDPLLASVSFWVIPWKLISYVLLGLIIIGLILWLMRKRLLLALKILFKGETHN